MINRDKLSTDDLAGQKIFAVKDILRGIYFIDAKSITTDTMALWEMIEADEVVIDTCEIGEKLSLTYKKGGKEESFSPGTTVEEIMELESGEDMSAIR